MIPVHLAEAQAHGAARPLHVDVPSPPVRPEPDSPEDPDREKQLPGVNPDVNPGNNPANPGDDPGVAEPGRPATVIAAATGVARQPAGNDEGMKAP